MGTIIDSIMLILFVIFMIFVFGGYHKNKSTEREALEEKKVNSQSDTESNKDSKVN